MGTETMSRLVIATGVPLMLSLLINSLYNFVDSVFVSRVSEDALTALSLAAPVQMFVSALGLGNAIGLNAAISKALGEKRPDRVRKAADASIFIAFCSWILISVLCVLFVKPYFVWQSGGNEAIAAYGQSYLSVCMLFSFGQMGQWVFDRFVMASGRSHLFLFTLSAASLTNLVLDPIFIFGLLGVPRMETFGAAVATVIGQITGMAAGILINRRWNREIPFGLTLRPDRDSILAILKVGVPSTLVQILTSFVSVVINSILFVFSSTAVAVYGICVKIQAVVTVGVHGIDNGMIPIVAYNYGAGKPKRIDDAVKWALIYSAVLYLPFFAALLFFPSAVLRVFNASESMLSLGIPALRIFALVWFVCIPGMVVASSLQGLSLGTKSMRLTMLRQAIFPVLLTLIFQFTGRLELIWCAFVLSEILALPVALRLWRSARAACFPDSSAHLPQSGPENPGRQSQERRNHMKRIASLFLVLVLTLSLTACGGGEAGQSGGDASSESNSPSSSQSSPQGDGSQTSSSSPDQSQPSGSESGSQPDSSSAGSHILVAYFSCTNNTEGIAQKLADGLGADLYEILPEEPYTDEDLSYGNDDCRANQEQNDPAARPAITGSVANIEDYDTVLIGYPIWWGKAPMIMSTFMESYDFTGKTIACFCTSGSSPFASSDAALRAIADGATWLDGQRFSAGASSDDVMAWADGLGIK